MPEKNSNPIYLPQRYADQASVSTIREVFDYIRRFKNHIFVLKIEDTLIEDPLFPSLMKDLIRLHETGIRIIIIPGTRATIERNLMHVGVTTIIVDGIRITPAEILPHVKLAAMEVSEAVISHLTAGKLNGIMGNWIKAHSLGVRDGIDFQCTGEVEKIRSDIILKLLDQDFVPVVHPIGLNAMGTSYNLNSTQVACALCMDINNVSKLFFIGENEGIRSTGLIIPEGAQLQANGFFSNLNRSHVKAILRQKSNFKQNNNLKQSSNFKQNSNTEQNSNFKQNGNTWQNANPGQNSSPLSLQEKEYLENAITVTSGENAVKRVHIISGRQEGSLLKEVFSSIGGGGTMIYSNRHAHIRRAGLGDMPELMQLLDGYVKKGNLVMRTEEDVSRHIEDYYIYEVDRAVYGCGALFELDAACECEGANSVYGEEICGGANSVYREEICRCGEVYGEISAIAVNPSYKSRGVGQGLMEFLIRLGRSKGFTRLFLLTTRTADWFYGFGFVNATLQDLPDKRKESYNLYRNSRVLMLNI